jgi:hypothetical protein
MVARWGNRNRPKCYQTVIMRIFGRSERCGSHLVGVKAMFEHMAPYVVVISMTIAIVGKVA